ncbi:hypothetical protein ScPMuIL_018866 [Solemya velum]
MLLHNRKSSNSKIWVYLQSYFVTIATILGTGILGLPVTLSEAGLYPFLISFIGGAFMQALLVYFFTELLQRAYALQLETQDTKEELVPLNDILADDTCDELEEEVETSGPVLAGHVIIPRDINAQPPNLHLMGEQFLGCGVRQCFDLILVLQFIALLISYALAGSEAYAQVIGINYFFVIPVFVWVLTFAVVFALRFIQPIVSILTFFKGTLLLATVIVTFFVGAEIQREVQNDFVYIGAPFLMGTVALGGVVNTMPFMYSRIEPVQGQIKRFRLSVILGLLTCTVLNILWCWAVLDIVPQTSVLNCENTKTECNKNISLQNSAENGEISTIPLTQIIHNKYPDFVWVATLVELFIMISITVSYLTIGAVLHHTLTGWVQSVWIKDKFSSYREKIKVPKKCEVCNTQCVCNIVLSLGAFGVVFSIAMLNPQGFIDILEKFASLTLNIEAGLFIFLMLIRARNRENIKLRIPLPMSNWCYHLQYVLPLYFGFAVVYDIYNSIQEMVHGKTPAHFLLHNHTSTLNKHLSDNDSQVLQNLSSTPFPFSSEYPNNSSFPTLGTTPFTVPEWYSNESRP